MGDAVQSICGAIALSSGFRTTQSFLHMLGILKISHSDLNHFIRKDIENLVANKETMGHIWKLAGRAEVRNVERVLGYEFKNKAYLVQALCHKSYVEAYAKKNDS